MTKPAVRFGLLPVFALATTLAIVPAAIPAARAQEVYRAHAIAMHGEPKYNSDITALPYANPDTPKSGTLRTGTIGTFDNFNPFISDGQGISSGFETLLIRGEDEPFTLYAGLAQEVEWPEDRSWVTFHLHPAARWHDGMPVTPEDVIFSFEKLTSEGAPFYRFYYASVVSARKVGERAVRFDFADATNRELPLIIGELPILAAHDWEGRDFSALREDPPLVSGPYRVRDFTLGRWVETERVADWWARDLPHNRGRHNFDVLRTEYFRDYGLLREIIKGGQIDLLVEIQAKAWEQGYDVDAVRDGYLRKELIPDARPRGMQAFVFNTRRPLFADARVRRALGYAFDFEWTNKTLLFNAYRRSVSYWNNSELGSRGLPQGKELELLESFRDQLPPELFTQPFALPMTDGSGRLREQLRTALGLLAEAGWVIQETGEGTRLINEESGEPFELEILIAQSDFERLVLPLTQNLERLGIVASVRLVDVSQYVRRRDEYDFDVVVGSWGQSESPGNEQLEFWGSEAADTPASRNFAGIKDPVVDALIQEVIAAKDRESLIQATRALDRVLLWGWYVIPQWYVANTRLVLWDRLGMPDTVPEGGVVTSLWWYDEQKANRLAEAGYESSAAP